MEVEGFVFLAAVEYAVVRFLASLTVLIPVDLRLNCLCVPYQEHGMSTAVKESNHLVRHWKLIRVEGGDGRFPPHES